jgi:hypothetical protein
VTKVFPKAVQAATHHKTMLINMARQLELKAATDEKKLDITSKVEKSPAEFVNKIMQTSRAKKVKGVKYAEIFRVRDSVALIENLAKVER